jgi:flagellar biosynthesis repressor protein FlbT
MPLKISLKPHEKVFIGGAVVQNVEGYVEFSILNDVPVLREKDVVTEAEVTSTCGRIYLCVQLMYMDPLNLVSYQNSYGELMVEVLHAAPSTRSMIAELNAELACGKYYQALKIARKLMQYEQELINHVRQPA